MKCGEHIILVSTLSNELLFYAVPAKLVLWNFKPGWSGGPFRWIEILYVLKVGWDV